MSDETANESPLLADPIDPVEPAPAAPAEVEIKPAPAPAPAPQPESAVNPRFKFYVLRVASNKEDRVKNAIDRKVKIEGVEEKVGRVLVPTERVRSMKGGVRKEADRKLYPGYVFIELEPDENGMIPQDVWFMVKETEGVGDFIQASGKPQPMSRGDRDKMLEVAEKKPEEQANLKTEYKKGDKIKVTDGAFENFEGEVDEILPDKGVVRIITTIFGRPTPLELEYWQIERV
ncbi:MAG: transcription termination/antitermination protein NusG [Planctomycetota bacterium]